MTLRKSTPGAVLAIAALLCTGTALAVYKRDPSLNVLATAPECDAGPSFHYTLTWSNSAKATSYQLNTGNQCKLAGTVCGISNRDCVVPCSEDQCVALLAGCLAGRGAPWVQVAALDGAAVYYRKSDGLLPGEGCQ